MTSPGELIEFIRPRRRYWLLPFFIPVLAVYSVPFASKAVAGALQRLPPVGTALFGKLHTDLVIGWARAHLRYSRHT